MRTNQANTGKEFERAISLVAARYQSAGHMRLKKVEPPTRIIGGGQFRKIIFLENPYLDWLGAWTERGGRAVFIECKSTTEPKLPVDGSGGVTTAQLDAIRNWTNAGAVAFVLWQWIGNGVKLVSVTTLKQCREDARTGAGFKHIKWAELSNDLSVPEPFPGFPDFRQVMMKLWTT